MSCRSTPYLRRLVKFGADCVVSPYVPHSWWHEFGRKAMVRRLEARGFPQIWGWLFVTLTIDQDLFEDREDCPAELAAYVAGNDRLRRAVCALRDVYAIKRWFWKFELTETGWPHWHVGLDTREFIANAEIADAWGLGFAKTKRVSRARDFRYLFKYVTKEAGEIPEWVLSYSKRIRVFQTSVGFYGESAEPRRSVVSRNLETANVENETLAVKFQRWGRRVNVRFRDARYRPGSAELCDSVESYASLFIEAVQHGSRALDAYHVAVNQESLEEIVKPWKPKSPPNPQPLKLYPSTLWARFRTVRTSSGASQCPPSPVLGSRTARSLVPL